MRVALSDVAFWMVGNLGKIAEVQVTHHERQKDGNYLYGAFGRDFGTKDGRRVMIVALTPRQWDGLVEATGLGDAFDTVAKLMEVDLNEQGGRFAAREVIAATLRPWVRRHTLEERPSCSTATASPGGRTRRSPSWWRRTRAARRTTPCSRRSSSRISAPT